MSFFRRSVLHFLGMAAAFSPAMPLAYAGGSGYVLVSLRAYAVASFAGYVLTSLRAYAVASFAGYVLTSLRAYAVAFFRRLCARFTARIRRRRRLSPLAIRPDDIEILPKAIDVRLSQ